MDKRSFEIEGKGKLQNIHDFEKLLQILNNETWDLPVLKGEQQFRAELAEKLCNFGKTVVLIRNDKEIGFASFYCNDNINRIGYVSLFAVDKEYRGNGDAHDIFQTVIKNMHEAGMNYLELEVRKDNKRAINFYKKEGLQIVLENEKTIYMMKDINCCEEF